MSMTKTTTSNATLTQDHEQELSRRWMKREDKDALAQLIHAHLGLVIKIATEFRNSGPSMEDLIQEGHVGLTIAARRFDPAKATRLATYATYWIRQSIQRALIYTGKPIRIPAYLVQLLSKWRRATSCLQEKLRRTPTDDEIARSLRLTKRQQALIKKGIQSYNSLPQTDGGEHSTSLEELVEDPHAVGQLGQ